MKKLIEKTMALANDLAQTVSELNQQFNALANTFGSTSEPTKVKVAKTVKAAKANGAGTSRSDAMRAAWARRRAEGTATRKPKVEKSVKAKTIKAAAPVKKIIARPAAAPSAPRRISVRRPDGGNSATPTATAPEVGNVQA